MAEEEKKKVKRPLGKARSIPGKCIACGARCQSECRVDAIEMNDKGEPVFDIKKCTGCRRCVRICPAEAIEIYFTPEEQKILDELAKQKTAGEKPTAPEPEPLDAEQAKLAEKLKAYRGVWVFVEQSDSIPAEVS